MRLAYQGKTVELASPRFLNSIRGDFSNGDDGTDTCYGVEWLVFNKGSSASVESVETASGNQAEQTIPGIDPSIAAHAEVEIVGVANLPALDLAA